jgi:hypothetical protein
MFLNDKKLKRQKEKKNVLICIEFGLYFKKKSKNIFLLISRIIILYLRWILDIK